MEENKKQFNWKSVLIVVMAVLIVFCLAKINEQTEKMDTLQSMIQSLQDQISNVDAGVNSIYDNIDTQLKKQVSLISGTDFSIGEASEDMKTVELLLTVVPKSISDNMQVSEVLPLNPSLRPQKILLPLRRSHLSRK